MEEKGNSDRFLGGVDIAAICHEANRVLCQLQGDHSQLPWGLAPEWARQSAYAGVIFHLENPEATPEQSHENWMRDKLADGWKYGPEKDPAKKEHPCLVPYGQLPAQQRVKDHLFKAIVTALIPFWGTGGIKEVTGGEGECAAKGGAEWRS